MSICSVVKVSIVIIKNNNDKLIQQVFNGLKIDETRLTKRNFTDTFDLVKENFIDLVIEM